MRVTASLLALSAFLLGATAAPSADWGSKSAGYNPFPLSDGFPKPSASQLKKIEAAAGGSLPNGALPSKLTDGATVTLQLIALNEIFEVAYFNSLLSNVTSGCNGYKLSGSEKKYAIDTFTAIRNQEELHALGANGILANAGKDTVTPCRYQFPVSDYKSAVTVAALFTDVVLSVLPLAQVTFAQDGGDETGLVQLVGSIIAQEGEQDGWYRSVQGKTPSAAPFLTTSNPAFAFTALQSFIVPGSCTSAAFENVKKNIPTFPALTVASTPCAKDSSITFKVKGKIDASNGLTYLTGQLNPVTEKIYGLKYSGGYTTFKANFPFASDGFSKGLTVAALTKSCSQYATAADVAGATVAGPGLIEL